MSEEKKLTDDTEIDVGMIEKTLEIDDTIYVWLLKGSIWKTYNLQKILDLIHRLQSENAEYSALLEKAIMGYYAASQTCDEQKAEIETLKTELRKECEEHEEFTKKAKEEIERLTRENANVISMNDALYREKAELQKQVDELKEERENMQAVIFELEEYKRKIANGELMECIVIRPEDLGHNDPVGETGKSFTEQAVKDTAKECYELFKFYKKHYYDIPLDLVARDIKEKTGVEVE